MSLPESVLPERKLGQGKRRWVLYAVLWANVTVWLDSSKTSLLTPFWAHDIHASTAQIANISSAYLLGYFPTLFIAGYLSDRLGPKRMLLICLTGVTVMGVTMSWVHTYGEMYWRNLIFGIFFGFLWAPCQRMLAVWFPARETARVTAIWVASMMSCAIIAPLIAVPIATHVNWRAAFLVVSALGLPGLFGMIFLTADSPGRKRGISAEEIALINSDRPPVLPKLRAREIFPVFKNPSVIFMVIAGGLATTPTWLIGTWTSYGVVTIDHVDPDLFTYVGPLAGLIPVAYSFFHGRAVNTTFRSRLKPPMLLGVGLSAVGFLVAALFNVGWVGWLLLIGGLGYMVDPLFWGSLNTYWVRIARPELTGTLNGVAAGLQVAFGYIIVKLSSNWLQPSKQGLSQMSLIWLIGAAVFVGAAIPVLLSREPRRACSDELDPALKSAPAVP